MPPTFHVQPLTLKPRVLASNPQVSKSGVRASDKGFLGMAWSEECWRRWALTFRCGVTWRGISKSISAAVAVLVRLRRLNQKPIGRSVLGIPVSDALQAAL